MTSFRDWLDPGGRMLARRVEQLRESLESLAGRLRESVAHAVGTTLGSVVRDTLLRVLENLTDYLPVSRPTPSWPSRRLRASFAGAGAEDEEGASDDFWPDDMDELQRNEPAESAPPPRSGKARLAVSLAAGLQVAWALRRCLGRRGWLALLGVGLLAGCAAYAAPALATAGLGLLGSASQLGVLADSLRALGLTG